MSHTGDRTLETSCNGKNKNHYNRKEKKKKTSDLSTFIILSYFLCLLNVEYSSEQNKHPAYSLVEKTDSQITYKNKSINCVKYYEEKEKGSFECITPQARGSIL